MSASFYDVSAIAQDASSKVRDLQRRVEQLEQRVAALEGEETYALTPKGKFVTDLMADGISYQRALELAEKHFQGGGS